MNELEGQWLDGQSSRIRRVRVYSPEPGILRLIDEAGGQSDWPLVEVSITSRLGGIGRTLRREGFGQIEVPDGLLIDQWFPRPASRVEVFADWLERRRLAILVATVGTALFVVGFFRIGVPFMADYIARQLPPAAERQISRQVVAILDRTYFRETGLSVERQQALDARFRALVADQPRSGDLRLTFVSSPVLGPNALALPDGSIYMTDQLVELAGYDDELLAVLAHEAGHHVHRHGLRNAIESTSVLLIAGALLGDVSGSSLTVALPAALLNSGFSRRHETEADAYAFDLLAERGISPEAFARIMERMTEKVPSQMEEGAMGYLSSHPPTLRRIAAAREAARAAGFED